MGTVVIFATLLLARSNLRAGRGDRRGAWRLFCFALTAMVAAWIVSARHYPSLQIEDDRLFEFLAHALLTTGTVVAAVHRARTLRAAVRASHPDFLDARALRPNRRSTRRPRRSHRRRDRRRGRAPRDGAICWCPGLLGEPPGQPRVTNLQMLLGARASARRRFCG